VRFKGFALSVLPLLLPCVFSIAALTQDASQATPQNPVQIPRLGANPDDREDEAHAKLEKDMARKLNHERQVQLQRDTESLLKLATELKKYVDKSNENMLSLDVVKKAEEIEKLARSVKDKMKAN